MNNIFNPIKRSKVKNKSESEQVDDPIILYDIIVVCQQRKQLE